MINFNNKADLINFGFEGFISYSELNMNEDSYLPEERGIYFVLNPDYQNPEFINPGVCGKHKGKNPNYNIEYLKKKYVKDVQVMYIGKAGGTGLDATLQSRIKDYLACSRNSTCSHSGGRSIWQLKNYNELVFCWQTLENIEPGKRENELIEEFESQFGKIPFANQNRGKKY